MNKKRLVSMLLVSAMTAALFTGCGSDGNQTSGDGTTSAGTNSTTEEAGIKEFTAFFGVRCSAISGSCFPNSIARIMGMICSGAVAGSFCCRRCCTAFSQNSSSGSCRNRSPVQRRSRNR